jgi:hypothetical protein
MNENDRFIRAAPHKQFREPVRLSSSAWKRMMSVSYRLAVLIQARKCEAVKAAT